MANHGTIDIYNLQMDIDQSLDTRGYARLGRLFTDRQADRLRGLYHDDDAFRSTINMHRHGFGAGEYKYLRYPLPRKIRSLRASLYEKLVGTANRWNAQQGIRERFPPDHGDFIRRCNADGQVRPTPLILRYGVGDFNCLHQDLYGDHVFPLQVVVLLSGAADFSGGEFVLTEQRPRMQSRVEVVPLRKGHGLAFAVNERPKRGLRGFYRVRMRHGVSEIRSGERFTLGLIFHDAA